MLSELNKDDQCQVCDPDVSDNDWSPADGKGSSGPGCCVCVCVCVFGVFFVCGVFFFGVFLCVFFFGGGVKFIPNQA